MGKVSGLLLVILSACMFVHAAELTGYGEFDAVVINSRDWHDVYSGTLMAELLGKNSHFLREPDLAVFLAGEIKGDRILLIEPEDGKMHNSLESILDSRGFEIQVMTYDDINLGINGDLDAEGHILVDPTYGYDSISVAPYASLTDSFVVFADQGNVDSIDAEEPLLYGDLDDAVGDRFPGADEIDTGSRFQNNIEMVQRFNGIKRTSQLRLSNGEFIERSLFKPDYPLLFVGNSRAPESVMEYLQGSDFEIATLVGNDLADHVTRMKRRLESEYDKELGVLLMVGKSSVAAGMGEAAIRQLDIFPIEIFDANLTIECVVYNQLLRQVEVTIQNQNELKVYFLTTVSIEGDGVLGDEDVQFIDGDKYKTLVYPFDAGADDLVGEVLVVFGSEPGTLERQDAYPFDPMEKLDVDDRSEITLRKLTYDRFNKAVRVTVENTGDVTAYVDIELADIIVDGEETIVSSSRPRRLAPGESVQVPVRVELSSLDLEEMDTVTVRAYYGQREGAMFKIEERQMEIVVTHMQYYAGAAVVLAAVLVLIIIALRRRKTRL